MGIVKLGYDDICSVHFTFDGTLNESVTTNRNYITYKYETEDVDLEVVRNIRKRRKVYFLDITYIEDGHSVSERCLNALAYYYNKQDNSLSLYQCFRSYCEHKPTKVYRQVVDFMLFEGEIDDS